MSRTPRSKLEAETAAVKQFGILQTKKVICFFCEVGEADLDESKIKRQYCTYKPLTSQRKGGVKTREDVCAVVFTAGSVSPCDLTAKPATEVRFQS